MKQIANNWNDYELIECGNGYKLERWKNIILSRPDPQAIWDKESNDWKKADAHYIRSNKGGGHWEFYNKIPEKWIINYKGLKFKVSPTNFKHTGIFPEQAANWDYMMNKISNSNKTDIKVLNLFAYTGGATLACAKAGASEVVHLDASKGIIQWAKENMELSNLANKKIRFIVDDALKFVQREKRRGRKYDAIIMDPPSYGRGPNNEVWKIEEKLVELIKACNEILSDDALFMIINCYTTGFSATVLNNVMHSCLKNRNNGIITTGENCIPIKNTNTLLPCGIYGRWEKK